MKRDEAVKLLRALADRDDPETAHSEADEILLDFIDDPEIEAAYNDVPKWYA